ncbi:MAG: hypothetical protein GVY11_03450 [Gammaproteobacteria bacterium]|jgi:hypothetical protein|nr:hypothetical protein [Gammaproteobacteria bacterium]
MNQEQFIFFIIISVTVFLAALMFQFRFMGGLVMRLVLRKSREDLDEVTVRASVAEAAGDKPVAGADGAAVDWLRQNYAGNLHQIRRARQGFILFLACLPVILIAGKLMGVV